MIDQVLGFVVRQLNQFLSQRLNSAEDFAVLSSLVDIEGNPVPDLNGKIVFSLFNIEREAAAAGPGLPRRAGDGSVAAGYVRSAAPLNLNLYVMVSASFGNYSTALGMLSSVLGYFQGHPVFETRDSDHFPVSMDKLTIELVNVSTQEMSNLWGVLGARHLPSVVYKLRMLTLQEGWTDSVIPAILAAEVTTRRT